MFILNALHAFLGYLGDIDFLIERSQAPGWVGATWNAIIAPTPKTNLIIILFLGIGFIYFYIKENLLKPLKIVFLNDQPSSFYQEDSLEENGDLVYYELYRVCVESQIESPTQIADKT